MSTRNNVDADVAIVGGGVAGLWLLNVLVQRSIDAVLLERRAYGDGQSVASQGLIHGGLKYALSGVLTGAADAIAAMPQRWRACLDGHGDIDLRAVHVTAPRCHMWSNDTAMGQLGAFFASKTLRSRIRRLNRDEYPEAFRHPSFAGTLYELDELCLDARSLLDTLAAPHGTRTLRAHVEPRDLEIDDHGNVTSLALGDRELRAKRWVLAAGAGNAALAARLGAAAPAMQRRPLKQVLVRAPFDVPIHAHCIGGLTRPEPRLTITTHAARSGRATYYLGGQLATDGAARTDAEQIARAREELAATLPWLPFADAEFRAFAIDRAEPQIRGAARPDTSFVAAVANVLVCWPTKLALAPDLGDRVLAALDPLQPCAPSPSRPVMSSDLDVATPPWGEA